MDELERPRGLGTRKKPRFPRKNGEHRPGRVEAVLGRSQSILTAYIDTSAILAIEFGEADAPYAKERIDHASTLIASNLMEAEVRSAMRRLGTGLDPKLISTWTGSIQIDHSRPEFDVILRAGYLRGADLWHVAVALFASPDPSQISFITLDMRQRNVARDIGFQT